MPSIEISAEQAAALNNGESITLVPEPKVEALHNVALITEKMGVYFIYDGYRRDGEIFATRWQRITTNTGHPSSLPVKTAPGRKFGRKFDQRRCGEIFVKQMGESA